MQPYKSYHTTVNYCNYRPASQAAPRSPICLSPRSVLISVWSISITLTTHNNAILTKSVLTLMLINITNIDWPCRQCLGRLYLSQPVLFSVWREKSSSAIALTPSLILTMDWPGRHQSRSSMSAVIISQYGFSK